MPLAPVTGTRFLAVLPHATKRRTCVQARVAGESASRERRHTKRCDDTPTHDGGDHPGPRRVVVPNVLTTGVDDATLPALRAEGMVQADHGS